MSIKKYCCFILFLLVGSIPGLFSDEYINSFQAEYFRYLELSGLSESPVISFHSFSAYDWIDNDGPWRQQKQKKTIDLYENVSLTLSDTTLFTSWNSNYARTALNDGLLWQGRGLNTEFKTGFELKSTYFEINFVPEITYSQNAAFDTVAPAITSNQASPFSYFYAGIDYPQRMGDESFYHLSWGQSEIRANYGPLTIGFSHENMIWGPAVYNPLIMSANAGGFPHIDFGIKRTETRAGTFEFRGVYGRLQESDFFNENKDDDYTLFSGYTFAWIPPWFPFFSMGINRSLILNWEDLSSESVLKLYNLNISSNTYGYDATDQRASIWMDWKLTGPGTRFYLELFKEDHNRDFTKVLLYPEHTLGFTFGGEQILSMGNARGFLIDAEISWLQVSRTYELKNRSGGTYYIHGIVYHGYSNEGQLLGAPCGPGADVQNLGISWFDNWGLIKLYASRINKNRDYVYSRDLGTWNQDVELSGGIKGEYFLGDHLAIGADLSYSYNFDRNYVYKENVSNIYLAGNLSYRY